MKKYITAYMRNFDFPLFFVYLFLCLFGLVMIYSASMMVAIVGKDGDANYYYFDQLRNLAVGFFAFLVGAFIPYKNYNNKGILALLMFITAIFMVWVFFFGIGEASTGSQSWIHLFGIMTFQPSEFAKLFIIIYIAGSFYNKGQKEQSIQSVRPSDIAYPILVWMAILFFVGMETDLGAVMILFVIAISVVLLSGIKGKSLLKFFLVLSAFGMLVMPFVALFKWDSIMNGSRLGRFQALSDPFAYAEGSGYQIINGYLAIASGGLQGVGLGQSIQKLGYLPAPQTDYISAIIAEELGIKGIAIVILGIGFIVYRCFTIAMNTTDPLARMIAGGIGSWIGFQTFVNLGGVSGIIPLTGVTLPFLSYGGTSMMMLSLALGILLNISMFYKRERKNQ